MLKWCENNIPVIWNDWVSTFNLPDGLEKVIGIMHIFSRHFEAVSGAWDSKGSCNFQFSRQWLDVLFVFLLRAAFLNN